MRKIDRISKKGFTLLELILVIAIIAVLAGIIVMVLNPAEKLGRINNSKRKSDVDSIKSAINQYVIDSGGREFNLSMCENTICEICSTRDSGTCTTSNKLNITELIGTQLSMIPLDPRESSRGENGTGYYVTKVGDKVKVMALGAELGEEISSDGVSRGIVSSPMFTSAMAMRNAPGPFAGAPIIQGGINGTGADTVTIPKGSQINNQFYSNLDKDQGSIVLWWTPEFSTGLSSTATAHFIFRFTNTAYLSYNYTSASNQFRVGLFGNSSVVTKSVTAGNTYLIVVRWDLKNPIQGSNYISLSIDDVHNYVLTNPNASGVSDPLSLGSETPTTFKSASQSIIEGFTVYRRPLFDGQYGIDVGNGDEIAQIYNNGTGKDPTLITGSWDVVFALPTNSATGVLTTGTGHAWSHPHSSNLLYTNTTNTGGFMMGSNASTDGWNEIPWYKVGGSSGVVAAYQPIGAASLAASYTNLANPATYDAIAVVAPAWDATNGWTFNGSTTSLATGVVPGSSGWSALVAVSPISSGGAGAGRVMDNNNVGFGFTSSPVSDSWYSNGPILSVGPPITTLSVMAFAAKNAYLNGISKGTIGAGNAPANPIYIGNNSAGTRGLHGNITATAIYSSTLTSTQVANVTFAMQNLSSSGTYLSPTVLASTEKIFAGGYKYTSNGANQGIYRTFTATNGGDYVLRALGHSDGVCSPQVKITRGDGTTEISHLNGTTTSTRTSPDVYIFTWESPAAEANQIQLINTASSGICYWHQVEVYNNLINSPSMDTGSGDPWIPSGWTVSSLDSGDTEQETSVVHSGSTSLQFNPSASAEITFYTVAPVGNFGGYGIWVIGDGNTGGVAGGSVSGGTFPGQDGRSGHLILDYSYNSSWTHQKAVFRKAGVGQWKVAASANATNSRYADDVYLVALNDVTLTVTAANEANSTETTGLRIDGNDTYTKPINTILNVKGSIEMDITPRHSFNVADKFGLTNPVIVHLFIDTNNNIKLYKAGATVLRLTGVWDGQSINGDWTNPVLNAGTKYNIKMTYESSTNLKLIVGGVERISTPLGGKKFGINPTGLLYIGSDNTGSNQYDMTVDTNTISFKVV